MSEYLPKFKAAIANDIGDWVVKGFIDTYQNIYSISADTKVISKLIELMLFPLIADFARLYNYEMILAEHQNHYPDVSFLGENGVKIAFDLKSTYRKSAKRVNGYTLGAFTGYFRDRQSRKNITFPYAEYTNHYVLGIIYSRNKRPSDERLIFDVSDLQSIESVAHDFTFLIQEKWKLAAEKPGSGNTKNIGSVKEDAALVNGMGDFASSDVNVFDDYWMHYQTKEMARNNDSVVLYTNLREYWNWRNRLTQ